MIPTGPASAADKDCGDFPSQKAAQIFFLKHGGPQSDPNGLDAEGDGIACESNPAPYYYKKTLPGGGGGTPTPVTVDSTVGLSLSRTAAISGEKVRLHVDVRPDLRRTVVLEARRSGSWHRVDSTTTSAGGKATFAQRAASSSIDYRVVMAKRTVGNKRYTADTSPVRTLDSQPQSAQLFLPAHAQPGKTVHALASFAPVRRHRPVTLQVFKGGEWRTFDEGRENSRGETRFAWSADEVESRRYRAVASRFHGADPAGSSAQRLVVSDTLAPGSPSGFTATAHDALVHLQWGAPAAGDLAGYRVYRSTTGTGDWELLAELGPDSTSYDAVGLENGTTYWFAITAVDESENVSLDALSGSVTPSDPTAPAVPQNVSAVAGDGVIDVSWTAVPAADLQEYRVYVSTVAGELGELKASTASTSTRVTGLVNGTTYFVTVSAVDTSNNESVRSTEQSATPGQPTP